MTTAAIMEDPSIIQLNIRYYQRLLTLHSTTVTRDQVLKLLGEAWAQLPLAQAEAQDRAR
jgi:hypothetical protein